MTYKCAYINDDEAVEAFGYLSEVKGIIPVLKSSHTVAKYIREEI